MNWEPITPRFDELIHFPTRLRMIAALATASELEFSALEDSLGISTSLLSKQLKVLADAGYVALEKRPQPFGRPRTWLRLTASGKLAYLQHVAALRALVGDVDQG
ncbi:MAG: transcriptional regulator [Micropruina sp.]|uniref:transcriptional regulator n=1 Tax=Micropruina sp. TaxID=2737536 RepID=UPI0039E63245